MLRTLTVQNLVVVRHVDIEFGPGLTVMSGETGAGKSILIEALGLALGERADSRLVRAGDARATVTAVFDLARLPGLKALLAEHEIDSGDECVVRRIVLRDGGSRAFINASPVPVQLLHELGARLVDIHSQHANQQMMKRDVQRELLDAYGGHAAALATVAAASQRWREARERLRALERAGQDRDRIELVRYQYEELVAAKVEAEEIARLETEHRRLANGAANLEQLAGLRGLLGDDEDGALSRLRAAEGRARTLVKRNDEAAGLLDTLAQALVFTGEALSEVERLEAVVEIDPSRLARLDDRIAALHALARKHQLAMADLPTLLERLADELAAFEQGASARAALDAELAEALGAYQAAAAALTKARRAAVKKMDKEITARVRELGLPHASFSVALTPAADDTPQPHGSERVEFTVATNPDQAPGPINRIASGGELSRIALAIQAATVRHAGIPVVVYDEVDTGIGGTTANIVGRTLRAVATGCQVICITHSPQVASAGDAHVKVSKSVRDGVTETRLDALDEAAREEEIARMLGAAKVTAASLGHARDLIAAATGRAAAER
ncbi:MAG: DNA repair protein RecN [Gammaproteobacteria bacterium]